MLDIAKRGDKFLMGWEGNKIDDVIAEIIDVIAG